MRRISSAIHRPPGAPESHEVGDGGEESAVNHRNAPEAGTGCLYGLIGDVARAGSEGTETNAIAVAANLIAYLSCAAGRSAYLPIGNTRHHPRLFCLVFRQFPCLGDAVAREKALETAAVIEGDGMESAAHASDGLVGSPCRFGQPIRWGRGIRIHVRA